MAWNLAPLTDCWKNPMGRCHGHYPSKRVHEQVPEGEVAGRVTPLDGFVQPCRDQDGAYRQPCPTRSMRGMSGQGPHPQESQDGIFEQVCRILQILLEETVRRTFQI